jgi:hypothetical protein
VGSLPRSGSSVVYRAEQVAVIPVPVPVPWKPNSVNCPAGTAPLYWTFVNRTAPLFPLRLAFQALVIVAPGGRVVPTVQPPIGDAPAVTRIVATNPPVHWLRETDAVHPPLGPFEGELDGGGEDDGEADAEAEGDDDGDDEGDAGGDEGPLLSTGVVQSRHSARLPDALLETWKEPAALPVFVRYR